jgi:hypothetical protein
VARRYIEWEFDDEKDENASKKKTLQPSKADVHTKPLFFFRPCQEWLRQKELLPNGIEERKKVFFSR